MGLKRIILAAVCIPLFFPAVLLANTMLPRQDTASLQETLRDINTLRRNIQKQSAAFLVITKQLGAGEIRAEQAVQVIRPGAVVRESDLNSSEIIYQPQVGDALPLTDQQTDWYQVVLDDGRSGWISREDVQLVNGAGGGNPQVNDVNRQNIRMMAENFYLHLSAQADTANQLFSDFEAMFESLYGNNQEGNSLYETFSAERDRIRLSLAYADHYYEKLAPYREIPVRASNDLPFGITGTVSTRFGKSLYESLEENSELARNINLSGSLIFNPQSRLTLNIKHNNDVIQTHYTTNDVNLGYLYRSSTGTRLQTAVKYNQYDDKSLDRNNFNNLGASLNVEHPLNAGTRLFGDFEANSKTYDVEGNNDYTGGQFNTGLVHEGANSRINLGMRGRIQSSDISFLDYQRFIPTLNFLFYTRNGSISLNTEAEQITYDQEAESNNYNRERVDLEFAGEKARTRFSVIAKQYTNNEDFSNIRFQIHNQVNRSEGNQLGRAAVSLLYVYHTGELDQLSNYIDLRYDRNHNGRNGYFDIGLFGRYWEDTERDHRIDIYSRFGLKFSGFEIGPVLGAQFLLDTDDLVFNRNGNSFRAGVDGRANFVIHDVIIHGSARYQKSFVYNSALTIDTSSGLITEGDIQTRMPTTIQITAGARTPLLDLFDVQLDISYYNIDLDVDSEISINPVETRSGLRVMAGVVYRFNKL